MFDWDDIRIFIAAARTGSLTGAAHQLGIDPATVGRRISRLESSMKSILLARSPNGLNLTASGAKLMEAALDAEVAMLRATRTGEDELVGGAVRISAAEGFGTTILAPALPTLRIQRPGLRVELAANSGFLSPSRREVDMAVTLSAPSDARLVVEPLTHYQLSLYASEGYLKLNSSPGRVDELKDHALVGYIEDLIYAPELRYLDEIASGLSLSIASSSIRAQYEIIKAGGGIGVLPCFLAQDLVPVLASSGVLIRRFWISTHSDVVDTARIRAVRRWLLGLVNANQNLLQPFKI